MVSAAYKNRTRDEIIAAFRESIRKKHEWQKQAEEEIEKAEKELEHLQKFLAGVRAKLSNERFTAHAPEAVVAMERKKESDALSKIEILEKKINQLKTNK